MPVRGIESTVGAAPPLVGRTLSQLGPGGGEVPFTTKTKPATTTTVRGYAPTATLVAPPVRRFTRVTLPVAGFASHAIESFSNATPLAPEPPGKRRMVTAGGAPFEKSKMASAAESPAGAASRLPRTATLNGAEPTGGTYSDETECSSTVTSDSVLLFELTETTT